MNNVRMFKALASIVNTCSFFACKGDELLYENGFLSNKKLSIGCFVTKKYISDLINSGLIEEILLETRTPNDIEIREIYNTLSPSGRDIVNMCSTQSKSAIDKKPISSEENTNVEEDIYSKKYNIYEILTLIPNLPKDIKFKSSLDDEILEVNHDGTTLNHVGYSGYRLENTYLLKDILEATYTIVKPVEEVKEKWAEIETHKDLCSAIVNKKMIRIGDGKPSNEYNDKQIETLFGALSHGVFKIKYLEEN